MLKDLRSTLSAPYQEVANLSPIASWALDKLKQTRFEATKQWQYYNRPLNGGNPDTYQLAKNLDAKADVLETALERIAQKSGRPELVDEMRAARTAIAKTHDIERALNVGDANVGAHSLGAALDRGKPLSGNLETTGRVAEAFPQETRLGTNIPSPGVSALTPWGSLLAGGGGYAATGGNKYGLMLAAVPPLVHGGARKAVTSDWYQRHFAQPNGGLTVGDTSLKAALLARAVADRNGGQ